MNLDATDLAVCEGLFNDPNILSFWRTGSYYLFGKTTTDRDIVCMCKDVVAAGEKYAAEFVPANEAILHYDSISVKFHRLPSSSGTLVTFNLILIDNWAMYSAWVKATEMAKLLHVTDKAKRVTLFTRFQEMALADYPPPTKETDNDNDF
jgi:hypothetical protein